MLKRTPLKRLIAFIAGLALFIAFGALITGDAHGRTFWQQYVEMLKLGGYVALFGVAFATVLGLFGYALGLD